MFQNEHFGRYITTYSTPFLGLWICTTSTLLEDILKAVPLIITLRLGAGTHIDHLSHRATPPTLL